LRYFCIIACLLFFGSAKSQETIKWYTWEEGIQKAAESPKKILVDIYTQWCKYCKVMDKNTFQNAVIAKYVNEHYIAIKFDAGRKDDIEFKGKNHKFVRKGRGYHALAMELSKSTGKLSFPTVVFIDKDLKVIQAIPGLLEPPTFDPILRYFAEDQHKYQSWISYMRDFKNKKNANRSENPTRLVNGNN